jgi:hypothetical protein
MKLKKEYLMLLLAIAALCTYLVTRTKDQTHFELPEMDKVESQKINRLEITKGATTIELDKKDDQWTIGPKAYFADGIKVRNMVNAAAGINLTALVSESGNFDRYDLTDSKKINVRAYADKDKLRDFDIGRQAPTHQHTFVKLPDTPNVYHAQGNINATFETTAGELRDKTVLEYPKEEIKTVTISKADRTLTISKKEAARETPATEEKSEADQPEAAEIQWVDAKGTSISTPDVDLVIGDFAKLKCDGFLDDNAKDGLKDPVWTVTLGTDNGKHMLWVYHRETDESTHQPAFSSGSEYAFKLTTNRIDVFEKHIDKLLNPDAEKKQNEKEDEKDT